MKLIVLQTFLRNEETSFPAIYKLGYNNDGDSNPDNNDLEVKSTLLRHGNYDYITEAIIWDQDIKIWELANSYY